MNKYKKVIREIKKYKEFLITSHINPEGDSLGSQIAFAYFLKSLGKKYHIVNTHKPTDKYKFLPGCGEISTRIKKGAKYDAICFLDCADLKRIGSVYRQMDLSKPTFNIDHHASNDNFADVNLVQPNASSAAEILYMLFKEAHVKITKEAAICLYTAILTDTGSFGYSNVTALTHKIASELVTCGADPNKISTSVYSTIAPATIKLLVLTLRTLRFNKNKTAAWIKLTKSMYKKSKASMEDENDFINFPRSIKGVKVAAMFTEINNNKTKVSFRSNTSVDVNKIASYFLGGGHKKASGCRINRSIAKAEKMVIKYVNKFV